MHTSSVMLADGSECTQYCKMGLLQSSFQHCGVPLMYVAWQLNKDGGAGGHGATNGAGGHGVTAGAGGHGVTAGAGGHGVTVGGGGGTKTGREAGAAEQDIWYSDINVPAPPHTSAAFPGHGAVHPVDGADG